MYVRTYDIILLLLLLLCNFLIILVIIVECSTMVIYLWLQTFFIRYFFIALNIVVWILTNSI